MVLIISIFRIHVGSIVSDIEYFTVCVGVATTVLDVVTNILAKDVFQHRDSNLFYLVLQLTDTNPSQQGLTRKTLNLDQKSLMVDYVPCQEWFDTRFILRLKTGTEVKIFLSVLMEDRDFVMVRLSDTTDSQAVVRLLLAMFDLEESQATKYSLFEEILNKNYTRRLADNEVPARYFYNFPRLTEIFKNIFHIRLVGKWTAEAGAHNSYVFRLKLNPHYYNLKLISYNKQTSI